MDNHQKRILKKMIDLIDDCLANSHSDLYNAIGELEGFLDASEIKDKEFIGRWYEHWTPLEIARADSSEQISPDFIDNNLKAMKEFIKKSLEERDLRE